jgi:starch synthase (maltosyl-transferring)
LVEPLEAAGIATICLAVRRSRPISAVGRLAATLRSIHPRLIQSFLFHANVASRFAAIGAGSPPVVAGIRVAERQRRRHLALDRWTTGLGVGSVCVSEGVLRFTRDVGKIDAERLTVIPNGVDPSRFDRAEAVDRSSLGIPAQACFALYVGRLDPQKGLPILLDAAGRVAANDPRLHLAIVGDGPELAALLDRAEGLPSLDERLHVLGRRSDIPALLKAADILVLPSLWEGMPNVVLEAMAARRAVIGTRVEGTEDLVVHEETGLLVPPGDVSALADALGRAVADPCRFRMFGEAGRARVEAKYAPRRAVDAYDRLWSGILGFEDR